MILKALLLVALAAQSPADLPAGVSCDDTSSFSRIREMFPSRPVVVKAQLLKPSGRAAPGALVECSLDTGDRELVFFQREAGEIGGIKYRVSYLDGSGSVGQGLMDSWFISCSVDPIEDTRSCRMLRDSLMVIAFAGEPEVVRVGTNHYPGSESVIRLDKGTPIRSRADGIFGESKKILAGLETCNQAVLRYREWPAEVPIDKTVPCAGFRQARSILQWALKSIPEP